MFPDGEYIDKSKFFGYCSNTCKVNYTESCLTSHSGSKELKPRFYKEFQKSPTIPPKEPAGGSCSTTNTTTFFQGADGAVEQFTLINPANCSFPFNYKGRWYNKCIAVDDPFCRRVSSAVGECCC